MADIDHLHYSHQKPLRLINTYDRVQTLTKALPSIPSHSPPQQHSVGKPHSHSRSISSSVFPTTPTTTAPSSMYTPSVSITRRTPSNATSSSTMSGTTAVGGTPNPKRTSSAVSVSLRRSISSRSGQSVTSTSYVALMRKQKATVWCDRSQHEDPRMVAQAKMAKMRATMEVIGGNVQSRTNTNGSSTSGVRGKIRHHVAPKTISYNSANMVGSAVPARLSASEVDNEDNDDDDADSQRNPYHQRSNSGRSSLASSQRLAAYNQRAPGRLSQGGTPPNGHSSSPSENAADVAEASHASTSGLPLLQLTSARGDYFEQPPGNGGSGGSSERESSFGDVVDMKGPRVPKKEGRSTEDIIRRGSVDERAATMRGAVRLFVANPDLTD